MTSKHPRCHCKEKRFEYLRRRYKNGTLHMFRKCPSCQKVAQNAMSQSDYDANWVAGLPVMVNGVMEQPKHSVSDGELMESRRPAPKPKSHVQTRADAIQAKLARHIESRTL